MKPIMILLVFTLYSSIALAHKKHSHSHSDSHNHGHSHDNLGAHVHGVVELALVSSGKQIAIELKSPGESLIGFEYEPKTDEEKSQLKALQDSWKADAFGVFIFAPNPEQCTLAQASLVPEYEGGHSVFNGEALYECTTDIQEQKLTINLREKFSNIKKLTIEALPEGKAPLKHVLEGNSTTYTLSF
jgi:hypothetical protein